MNTPTPRTDAAIALTSQHRHDDLFGDPEFGWVTAGFARTLETELAAAQGEMAELHERLEQAAKDESRLRNENTRLLEAILNAPSRIADALTARKEGT